MDRFAFDPVAARRAQAIRAIPTPAQLQAQQEQALREEQQRVEEIQSLEQRKFDLQRQFNELRQERDPSPSEKAEKTQIRDQLGKINEQLVKLRTPSERAEVQAFAAKEVARVEGIRARQEAARKAQAPSEPFETTETVSASFTRPEVGSGPPGLNIQRGVLTAQRIIPGTNIPIGKPEPQIKGFVKAINRGEEIVVDRAVLDLLAKDADLRAQKQQITADLKTIQKAAIQRPGGPTQTERAEIRSAQNQLIAVNKQIKSLKVPQIEAKSTEEISVQDIGGGQVAIKKQVSPEGVQAARTLRSLSTGQRRVVFESTLFSERGKRVLGGLIDKDPESIRQQATERLADVAAAREAGTTGQLALQAAVSNPFSKAGLTIAGTLGAGKIVAASPRAVSFFASPAGKGLSGLGAAGFFTFKGAKITQQFKAGDRVGAFGEIAETTLITAGAIGGFQEAFRTSPALQPKEIRGIRITEQVRAQAAPFAKDPTKVPAGTTVKVSKTGRSALITQPGKEGFATFQGKELIKPSKDFEVFTGLKTADAQKFGAEKFFLFKTRPVKQILRTSAGQTGTTVDVFAQSQVGVPVTTKPPTGGTASVFKVIKPTGPGRDLFAEKGASSIVSKVTGGRLIFKPKNILPAIKAIGAKTKPAIVSAEPLPPKVAVAVGPKGNSVASLTGTPPPGTQVAVFDAPISLPRPTPPTVQVSITPSERRAPEFATRDITRVGPREQPFQGTISRIEQELRDTPIGITGTVEGARTGLQPIQTPIQQPRSIQQPVQIPFTTQTPIQTPVQLPGQIQQPIQTPIQAIRTIQTPVQQPIPFTQAPPAPPGLTGLKGAKRRRLPSILREKAFDVFVRRKGLFEKISRAPLARSEALKLGAREVTGTAARTFKLVESEQEASLQRVSGRFQSRMFRAPKRDKERDVFVEKSAFAIDQPGEFREITQKGLQAQRRKTRSLFGGKSLFGNRRS